MTHLLLLLIALLLLWLEAGLVLLALTVLLPTLFTYSGAAHAGLAFLLGHARSVTRTRFDVKKGPQ